MPYLYEMWSRPMLEKQFFTMQTQGQMFSNSWSLGERANWWKHYALIEMELKRRKGVFFHGQSDTDEWTLPPRNPGILSTSLSTGLDAIPL